MPPKYIILSYAPGDHISFGGVYQFAGSQVTGTVNSITRTEDDRTAFATVGVNADVQRLFAFIEANEVASALHYVFRDEDQVSGSGLNDILLGYGGDDTVDGWYGRDRLIGGEGRDILTGGRGADRFIYLSEEDTGTRPTTRDVINDFSHDDRDRINLSAIDADDHTHRNESFTLVDAFTGTAGEVMVQELNGRYLVLADTDGNARTDFSIMVRSDAPLVASDFIL